MPPFEAVRPWLAPLPADRLPTRDELNALVPSGVVTGGGRPLVFAPPRDAHYEMHAYCTGEVATRDDNWHDFFNALAWLAFPRTKAAINRQHHRAILQAGGTSGPRGTARDVLTLFDEGGVIVAGDRAELLELIRSFRWKEVFWHRREEVRRHLQFFVLGHAILEKALRPYRELTAKALLLVVEPAFHALAPAVRLEVVDARAAAWLEEPGSLSSTRRLAPLPVLGIPGWADNDDPAFYDDERVFRTGYRN